jgi:hypothetical protein
MNALGKVLTVFVFLGSLAWLGLTVALFSTRMDWKRAAQDAEKNAKEVAQQAEKNTKEILDRERAADAAVATEKQNAESLKKERDQYRTDLEDLKTKINATNTAIEKVQPAMDKLQAANDTLQKTVDSLTTENSKLTKARDEAVIQEERAKVRATNLAQELNVTKTAFDGQVEKTRLMAEQTKGSQAPDADFRGDVLAVKDEVILFSGGANAGVKSGKRYVVTRPSDPFYVGTVLVIDASDPKSSYGIFSPAAGNKLAGKYVPKVGDQVSAK